MLTNVTDYLLLRQSHFENKPGLLIGSAPSVSQLRKFKNVVVRIGVGDLPFRAPEFGPYDFWVASNGYYPLPQKKWHSSHIAKYCKNFVFSCSCVQRSKNIEEDLLKIIDLQKNPNYIFFDERHFGNSFCSQTQNCCEFSKRFDVLPTIQEITLQRSFLQPHEFATSSTVATYGLSLAVILGLNPIFISGIEIPRNLKNHNWYRQWKTPVPIHFLRNYLLRLRKPQKANDFGEGFDETIKAFAQIVDTANSLGTKIYCMSKNSALLTIPGIIYLSIEEAMQFLDGWDTLRA